MNEELEYIEIDPADWKKKRRVSIPKRRGERRERCPGCKQKITVSLGGYIDEHHIRPAEKPVGFLGPEHRCTMSGELFRAMVIKVREAREASMRDID